MTDRRKVLRRLFGRRSRRGQAICNAGLHLLLCGVACFGLLACSRPLEPTLRTADFPRAATAGDGVVFIVLASPGGQRLQGVKVMAATADGLLMLDETDTLGEVMVGARRLRELAPSSIIFCHKDFFCGAIVTEWPAYEPVRQEFIALAPGIVY